MNSKKIASGRSIRHRFTYSLVGIVTGILLIFSIAIILYNVNTIEEELEKRLEDASKLAGLSLPSALWQFNYEYVNDFIEAIFLDESIVFANVMAGREVVDEKYRPGFPQKDFAWFRKSPDFIVKKIDIVYEGQPVGKIQLAVTRQRVQNAIITNSAALIILLAVVIAAISLTIFLISRRYIFRPLLELESSAELISKGDLDAFIDTSGTDEIGHLATTFDQMIKNVKSITTSRDELNREIKERRQAEVALRESEKKYRLLIENATDAIFIAQDEVLKFANPKAEKMTGYSAEELAKFPFVDIIHPEDRDMVLERHLKRLKREEIPNIYSFRMLDRSGEELSVELNAVLINWEGRSATLNFLRDITAQKNFEAQLQQAQKMETIATLAGGIAHEFNNALMVIVGNIELLKMELPEDEGRDKYFEAMKDSGHRMSRLTDQLLAYAQGGSYQPRYLKLDEFVIETLPILEHDLSSEVRVERHFSKDISHIKADHTQMQMVLSAILANSNEAIEDEGLIRITAENKDIDEDFTKQHPGLKPGPYVCLTIEDDGKGMDEETRNRIFEPFFTTKFQGRGMGMAAVYGIAKNHDGWVSVDSELGRGTVVKVYLPVVEAVEEVEKGVVLRPKVKLTMGEGTILVIEDEEVLVGLFRQILEILGYRVLQARTGKEAVKFAKTFDGQIDLALLDIKLPDMDGGRVYPLIMEVRPNLKVIVCSGYSIDGPARAILDAGAEGFIQKPFSISAFAEKLKEVLGD